MRERERENKEEREEKLVYVLLCACGSEGKHGEKAEASGRMPKVGFVC